LIFGRKPFFVDIAQKFLWGRFWYHGQMCPLYSVKKNPYFLNIKMMRYNVNLKKNVCAFVHNCVSFHFFFNFKKSTLWQFNSFFCIFGPDNATRKGLENMKIYFDFSLNYYFVSCERRFYSIWNFLEVFHSKN
jgi:hypothetical protein